MKPKIYMILLADRKQARMFTLIDGAVEENENITNGHVPQIVKEGGERWDAQDKIFRHIEDHLHRHLSMIGNYAAHFAKRNQVTEVIIGSHKPLFRKIEKHLPYPLQYKVTGRFVTELKAPFNEILRRANFTISEIEKREKYIIVN